MRACPRCLLTYRADAAICSLHGEALVESETDPLIGRTVDRYLIRQVIGAGATARVYRAVHTDLGTDHAIKIISGEMAANPRMVERLRREAQAASRIAHPNVVSVHAHGTTAEGVTYIVMALAPGRTLAGILAREGALPHARAARIIHQVALGLGAAHRSGFVHRDLKPGNLMIDTSAGEDQVKILDFGLVAALPDEGRERETRLTRIGHFTGTPQYAAPELIRSAGAGSRDLAPASDLYSLGAVLYELLAGRPPFEGTVPEILGKHLRAKPPPLPAGAFGGLDRLALQLLAKEARDRPRGTRAVVRALVELGFAAPGEDDGGDADDDARRIVRFRPHAALVPYFVTGVLAAVLAVSIAAKPSAKTAPISPPRGAIERGRVVESGLLGAGIEAFAAPDQVSSADAYLLPIGAETYPPGAAMLVREPEPDETVGLEPAPSDDARGAAARVRKRGAPGARARLSARGRRRSPH